MNHTTEEELFHKWEQNPEPSFPAKNPQVILDANLEGTAWLFDSMNETEAKLVFSGETVSIDEYR